MSRFPGRRRASRTASPRGPTSRRACPRGPGPGPPGGLSGSRPWRGWCPRFCQRGAAHAAARPMSRRPCLRAARPVARAPRLPCRMACRRTVAWWRRVSSASVTAASTISAHTMTAPRITPSQPGMAPSRSRAPSVMARTARAVPSAMPVQMTARDSPVLAVLLVSVSVSVSGGGAGPEPVLGAVAAIRTATPGRPRGGPGGQPGRRRPAGRRGGWRACRVPRRQRTPPRSPRRTCRRTRFPR